MIKIAILFVLNSVFIYTQEFAIKRLFNISADIKNPSFFFYSAYGYYNSSNDLLFEIAKDSSIDIAISHYNSESDSFLPPILLISNSKQNINPSGESFGDNKFVIFQTNVNGNWDIGYKEFKNNEWNKEIILSDSTGDETNPSSIISLPSDNDTTLRILYEKNNSIFLFTRIKKEIILKGSDSIQFSQPTGIISSKRIGNKNVEGYEIAAKMKINNIKKIISVFKPFNGEADTNIVVIDSGIVSNPKFQLIMDWDLSLTYEKEDNIYLEDPYNFATIFEPLRDSVIGRIYNLNTIFISRPVTKRLPKKNDVPVHIPYTFVKYLNDSTFIFLDQNYFDQDVYTYTKVNNNRPSAGFAGFNPENYNEIDYIVWEDSIDNYIQLLGKRFDFGWGDVGDGNSNPYNFSLYQNYPNPFNPSTIIKFVIAKTSFVTLKIFNVLGQEAATLVNEEKIPGEYNIKFEAGNFASGIYFYKLNADNFTQSKKMVFIR